MTAMDFFARQDAARRSTALLVFYFCAAVVLIALVIYTVVAFILFRGRLVHEGLSALWEPALFPAVTLSVLAVVAIGSLSKIVELRRGGSAVAESLGGRLVQTNTLDLAERRLLNVVEEMALASGVSPPPVYALDDEKSVNAFAAGYTPDDAVIGVTRGAMRGLDRDELQGVIAHEYSHILNGDMRLNIRLMGVLNGILLLAIIGRVVLHTVGRGSGRSKKGNGVAVALMIALTLLVVGSIGVFFGKLIKSAVSRQREFLADASSVQFTRNPLGLVGALKKIGGLFKAQTLSHPRAEQASHMYFANGVRGSWLGMLATHPPLKERILRIDPSFDGLFESVTPEELERSAAPAPPKVEAGPAIPQLEKLFVPLLVAVAASPETVLDRVGKPADADLTAVRQILDEIPQPVLDAAREPFGARAVVYALLVGRDEKIRTRQLYLLEREADAGVLGAMRGILPLVESLPPRLFLPLLDLAIPALAQLTVHQYGLFKSNVTTLVEADEKLDPFEYALRYLLLRPLDERFDATRRGTATVRSVHAVSNECSAVLSLLARAGEDDEAAAREAFDAAVERLDAPGAGFVFLPPDRCGFEEIDRALDRLAAATPTVKRLLVVACMQSVVHDGRVHFREAELFRAVAAALDCPVPPWAGVVEAPSS
jgi:Zn-dependent protease with chaperone function